MFVLEMQCAGYRAVIVLFDIEREVLYDRLRDSVFGERLERAGEPKVRQRDAEFDFCFERNGAECRITTDIDGYAKITVGAADPQTRDVSEMSCIRRAARLRAPGRRRRHADGGPAARIEEHARQAGECRCVMAQPISDASTAFGQ
ncbi:hypothetical protein WI61_30045 [Burkholderia cepacia]|nr:hypothetical protein WI48_19945 [Burkholderia cepacia]KVA58959.1 hypothetical protein WI47_34580 [Burkholderia cepacia]KVA70663.1 hypothetical protein WI49_36435 [Burkholderia cepacia]KVA83047.1 hypothetical protein WI50_21360 [Burkholderia cepacia]KVA89461.1 hypothetical protein WI51_13130 [Burkholderia cepacia]